MSQRHRKIEHNEKVCRTQEFGSYAQGQDHNQVRGQIAPKTGLSNNLNTTQANLNGFSPVFSH